MLRTDPLSRMARANIKLSVVAALMLSVTVGLMGCQAQTPTAAPQAPAATAAPAPVATAPAAAPAATAAPKPAATTAAPAPQVLKLGISVGITGPGARVQMGLDRFLRMSIEDINAKGGVKVGDKVYTIEAVTADDKGTSEGAREAANRLVLNEKVKFVMGTSTAPTAGAQAVTEPAKVLIFAFTSSDKSLGKDFPLTLQGGLSHNIMRSGATYDWLIKERPAAKRVAAVYTDDSTGRAIADVSEAHAKARGLTMVAKEFYATDIKDFMPLLTRVMRLNPDVIDSAAGSRGPLFMMMLKGLAELGYKGVVMGTSGDQAAMREGAPLINLFVAATLTDPKSSVLTDTERSLMERFIAKYGESELEPYTTNAYNIPMILTQAIAKAGTIDDAEKVAKTLVDSEWDTIWTQKWGKSKFLGEQTLGKKAVLSQPVYLSKVENQKIETFTAIPSVMP